MELTVTISENDYPELFKYYKKGRDEKIEQVLKAGYDIIFPDISKQNDRLEYHKLMHSIDDMRYKLLSDNNMEKDVKMEELLEAIQALTGIKNNSSKKGEVGENMLDEIISKRYGDINFENKAKTPHSGDAWLHLPDKKIVMLESKNYNTRINKDEVEKMEFDMKTNHIRFGIFVSWNSVVQNRRDLDIHTFSHNAETYVIVIISNLGSDILKLDLSIQLIRKLLDYFDKTEKFPWLISDIKDNLNELDIIIQKNYMLRDNFYDMSKTIRDSLDKFYLRLREYQYEINSCAQDIINKIDSTMKNSISNEIISVEENKFLDNFKSTKLFPILGSLLDMFKNLNLTVKESDKTTLVILKENELICNLKIQKKKVILSICKLNINMELEPDNYLDTIKFIPNLCNC